VHNTYFTLPVLFTMTSNHFAMTYSHEYNWLILLAITLAGALIRVYFVLRHKGTANPAPLIAAALVLAAVVAALIPASAAPSASANSVTVTTIRPVIEARCVSCHSATPTHLAFPAAPAGVLLDTDQQIIEAALRIHQQTVVLRTMPIGNLTEISEDERQLIDAWYRSGAR
jgi:uncharacterized membrane protein